MITISKGAKLVTLINVFTVDPANQQRIVDLLARATESSVRYVPGFVSATLHRSLDGTPTESETHSYRKMFSFPPPSQ